MENQDFELIEKFRLNKMSEQEKRNFNNRMASDEEFRALVELGEDISNSFSYLEANKLKAKLQNETVSNQNKKAKRIEFSVWKIAASLLLICLVSYLLWIAILPKQNLYAEYFVPYPNVENPTNRSEESSENPYSLYELGEFEQAIILLEKDSSVASVFYQAQCHLMLDDTEKAIPLLQKVSKMDSKYKEPAYYYLGLTYLKVGKEEAAEAVFVKIVEQKGYYSEASSQILKQLHNISE